MRMLPALAITAIVSIAAPALALPATPQPATDRAVIRIADLERAPARKARAHRYYHRYAPARVVITSGHPLSRFPGEIQYRYLPGTYCCCCRGR
jgi:hypothetical protein